MKERSHILKIQPDPDGLDFAGLREEGFRLSQEISGDVWSDYNLHDPGVTILEQLCYGLTDLAYRSGFDAKDYLASPDGKIDYSRLALCRPDEIFSCSPVTVNDYRKLILNGVPNVDNVWIRVSAGNSVEPGGLHHIHVQLSDRVEDQENPGVKKAYSDMVGKILAANRNLCEDLACVMIARRIPYHLRGSMEIEGGRAPASILAEVCFECANYLGRRVAVHSHRELYEGGKSLEELFTGPYTEHGYIADEDLHPWAGHFSIPELLGKVIRIEGVRKIEYLFFVDGDGNELEIIDLDGEEEMQAVACFMLPDTEESPVGLFKGGKRYPVSMQEVAAEYERLDYKIRSQRYRKSRFDWVGSGLPEAQYRNPGEYYSIQNHFPDVYGLNHHGVPESAPQRRKAQAAQLKAYLMLFEQIMANFLQGVEEIPLLFSREEEIGKTVFHQHIGNDALPGAEELYLADDAEMGRIVAGFDDYGDRRNRVLDYLLSLYGEKFSQNSMQHLFEDVSGEKIRNKIAFLGQIAETGRDRFAAFNYRKPDSENGMGLQRKLQILLGLPAGESHVRIVEHILLRPSDGPALPVDFYGYRISVIFPSREGRMDDAGFRKLAEETVYLNCPAHVHPEIFWLDPEQFGQFDLHFGRWREEKRKANNADDAARHLVHFLLELGRKKDA